MIQPLSTRQGIVRTLVIVAFAATLAFLLRNTRVEEDPILSLAHPDPVRAALFDHYQERGVFHDRIYVEEGELTPAERTGLAAALADAGYAEVPLWERPSPEAVLALAPLLPAADVRELLSEPRLRERAHQAAGMAMLPGGDAYLAEVEQDPLGIGPALLARLAGPGARPAATPRTASMHAYRSPRPLRYDRVGNVYDTLAALGPRVHFIGGDFFALENYRAANHDIVLCSALTLILNLIVFWFFTRRWALLGMLFLGSVLSGLTGILAIRAFYPEVFAVVLAYTSTFVGYNNESLVHLAGLRGQHRGRALLGVWSAIGTTVIGFLVLLLGRSAMVRQMALASLGGLVGFLLFLVPYRRLLAGVSFRTLPLPRVAVGGRTVAVICLACAAGIALVGVPRVTTQIEGFRFQTGILDEQVAHFSRSLDAFGLDDVVAVEAPSGPAEALAPLAAAGAVDLTHHPLAGLPSRAAQEETVGALAGYGQAVERLDGIFAELGIRLQPVRTPARPFAALDGWTYLELLGSVSPVRWTDTVDGRRFVMAGLTRAAAGKEPPGAVPVSPRHYYDELLTTFSRELGWLFLAGLAAMAVYLIFLQRKLSRVLYVFAPLFLSALAFAVYARIVGGGIHIVHVMGFSLIIALALDYTAVAVSGQHGAVELSKVLLTGVSTLATFGILLLARHPVLRDLGATVTIGCSVSLAFALFVSLRDSPANEPSFDSASPAASLRSGRAEPGSPTDAAP